MPTSRAVRAVLAPLVVALLVAAPVPGGAQMADDGTEQVPSDTAALPFPGVAGVDLVALGYDGPSLDTLDLAPADASALPEDLFARAEAASARVSELGEQRQGLEQAAELLSAVVEELNPRIAEQRRAEAFAAERLEAASLRARTVARRIRTAQAQLDQLQDRMVDAAIAAYIRPPDADTVGAVLDTGATSTAQLAAPVLHEAKFEHDVDLEDRHEVSLATLESRRQVLVRSERSARQRHTAVSQQLGAMIERRDAHAQALFVVQVALLETAARIDSWRAVLEKIVESFASSDNSIVAAARSGGAEVPVVVVEGFRIHAALAPRLEAMVQAAREDGIVLRGWGHRSHQSQIALRKAHCGPEPENVWLKPAGRCSPPTAIPGTSMHEIGLAVDFTHAGAAISSRESPAFQWLAANAAEYGFFNLPSEPWHWSVNGK